MLFQNSRDFQHEPTYGESLGFGKSLTFFPKMGTLKWSDLLQIAKAIALLFGPKVTILDMGRSLGKAKGQSLASRGGHGKNFRHRGGGGWVYFSRKFFFHFLETFFLAMNIGLFLFILVVRLQKSCNIHVFSSGLLPKKHYHFTK